MSALWLTDGKRTPWTYVNRWVSLFRGRTVSRRLLAPVLPSVIGVTILLGLVSYLLVRRQIVHSVRQVMTVEVQNAAHTIEGFLQQRLNDLESLSDTPLIEDYHRHRAQGRLKEAEGYRRELERTFKNFSKRSKVYFDISYVAPDGTRVCSLRPAIPADRYRASFPRQFIEELRRGKRFDPPLQPAGEGGPLVKRYAKAVFDENGGFLGAIVTDCDMNAVEDILRGVRVGTLGGASIEDLDGHRLLGLEHTRSGSLLRREMPVIEADGVSRWRVVVTVPEREFLDPPLRNILGATLLLSVAASLFLMLMIVARVSDLMEPIQGMVEGTKRFASGDLTFRFPALKSVELDVLAASFNRMAETLEARNKELEQRLRIVTALRDMEETVIQRQDEETVLRTCLEAVARGFTFDRTGMYWVDPVHKEIVGRYLFGSDAAGFSEIAFKKRRLPLGADDVLNDVVRQRRAMVVREPSGDARVHPLFANEAKVREFCLAPICGKDRVLGVITADNYYSHRPFTETDREGLMLYANAVGLALENALLFQNLAESESKLRTVLENSPEAIIGLSREHWISTWNRGAEKIFGFSAGDVLGKPLTVLFPKSAGAEFKRLLNQVMEQGAVRDFTMPGQTRDGKALELSVSWGGQHQDFWMNKEWTLVIRNVTESRHLQQQLIRSEKLSAVGQLISGIAHELNNPLQAVVGYSDILSDDMRERVESAEGATRLEPKDVLNDLRIITENAMRCQKIIENLLLFVRQGDIEKRPVDVGQVVQSSRELLQYKLKRAAHVDVEVDLGTPAPRVRGNIQQVQQVFVNLINNACDAMGVAPGKKILRISARELPTGFVRVEVADSGPGIPDAARERLFEPFFTTKAEGRGTGLGLPVCRQIVEEHGGKIGFTSEPGQGTTFWFELPLCRDAAPPPSASAVRPPSVQGKSILLVDDEPDVLGFLSKVIRSEGNHLEVAASLKDAINKAVQRPFDLVLTDVRLGEGTGFSLYENWSLWVRHPRPGFLFMTGDVLNGTTVNEIEKRGLQLLHKPIDVSTLQNAIRNALTSSSPGALNRPPAKS